MEKKYPDKIIDKLALYIDTVLGNHMTERQLRQVKQNLRRKAKEEKQQLIKGKQAPRKQQQKQAPGKQKDVLGKQKDVLRKQEQGLGKQKQASRKQKDVLGKQQLGNNRNTVIHQLGNNRNTVIRQLRHNHQKENKQQIMFNTIKEVLCHCIGVFQEENSELKKILPKFQSLYVRNSHGLGLCSNIPLKAGDVIFLDFDTRAFKLYAKKNPTITKAIEFFRGKNFQESHALDRNSLFPITSLLNHSDNPNCLSTFTPLGANINDVFQIAITQCIKDIEAGEELTINYQPGFKKLAEMINQNIPFQTMNTNQKKRKIDIINKILQNAVPEHFKREKFIKNKEYNELFLYLFKKIIELKPIENPKESAKEIVETINHYNNVYLILESINFLEYFSTYLQEKLRKNDTPLLRSVYLMVLNASFDEIFQPYKAMMTSGNSFRNDQHFSQTVVNLLTCISQSH